MPSGKQNSYANRTLPDGVYVTLRTDQPVNLCGAYEKAIPATSEGYVKPSKERLISYAKEIYKDFTGEPKQAFSVGSGLEDLAPALPLKDMLGQLEEVVAQYMEGKKVE